MSDSHGGGHSDTRLRGRRSRGRSSGPSRRPPSGQGSVSHLERANTPDTVLMPTDTGAGYR